MAFPVAAYAPLHQNADRGLKVVVKKTFFKEVHEDTLFTDCELSRQSTQEGSSHGSTSEELLSPAASVSDCNPWHQLVMEPDSELKVIVKNTFFDVVPAEDMPFLRQASAPGTLSLSRQSTQESGSFTPDHSRCQAILEASDVSSTLSEEVFPSAEELTTPEKLLLVEDEADELQGQTSGRRRGSARSRRQRHKRQKQFLRAMAEQNAHTEPITSLSLSEHQHREAHKAELPRELDSLRSSPRANAELQTIQVGAHAVRTSGRPADTAVSKDFEWKFVVKNTFIEAVLEEDMPMVRQTSAPSRLSRSRSTETDSGHASSVDQLKPTSLSKTAKRNQRSRQKVRLARKAQGSSAALWQGRSPSALERLQITQQFMDMFEREYKLDSACLELRSLKLMTLEELAEFNCNSSRPLVSVHGYIFDVSKNLHQYGSDGARSFEAGSDITWAVIWGSHTEEDCNCFYDVFKAEDDRELASRCMSLCSTIAAFQRDYGKAVGRLTIYNEEMRLPPSPSLHLEYSEGSCPVQ